MRRVVIFRNGCQVDGKVIMVTHSMQDLLRDASRKLNMRASRAFTSQGGEIDDVQLIKDDDVLYISGGEPFVPVDDKHYNCVGSSASKANDLAFKPTSNSPSDWVSLNVGGKIFSTTRSTLVVKEPNSMLSRMFACDPSFVLPSLRDSTGAYLIDRSPEYFGPILGYLRHGQLIMDRNMSPRGVLEEAKFYGITSLIQMLENMIVNEETPTPDVNAIPLTRRDVIDALISTAFNAELRFQGINLAGADLSRLDLRHINFKYAILRGANLQGANLSYCCLERCDLSGSNMESAVLYGVKMVCANMEGANLRTARMEDPLGKQANMEGVNLKGACLEGSQMCNVNLRVATLKNANLQNCDLKGATLAGADLENCDLSGSDLHEANLRGANLKNAMFELMLTPLHARNLIIDQ